MDLEGPDEQSKSRRRYLIFSSQLLSRLLLYTNPLCSSSPDSSDNDPGEKDVIEEPAPDFLQHLFGLLRLGLVGASDPDQLPFVLGVNFVIGEAGHLELGRIELEVPWQFRVSAAIKEDN